ncbi:hypothetical protein Pmani_010080 [Petrolisthes manimaculis]|uniref:Uncharacterized protein n=1 Tax=Petrolisthes manimaculis TaxID=1843537 RepID=A0AAE1UCC0_9EUCA|nr:hypothetical protein Pmani_010080 [Petrolisthes manimaculis]
MAVWNADQVLKHLQSGQKTGTCGSTTQHTSCRDTHPALVVVVVVVVVMVAYIRKFVTSTRLVIVQQDFTVHIFDASEKKSTLKSTTSCMFDKEYGDHKEKRC